MKNLVKGYELLDDGLKNYVIKKIFMTYKHLEIIAMSEDGTKIIKLQFEVVEDISLGTYDVDSVISKMDLEKTDDNMLLAKIENSEDVEMKLTAQELSVIKI